MARPKKAPTPSVEDVEEIETTVSTDEPDVSVSETIQEEEVVEPENQPVVEDVPAEPAPPVDDIDYVDVNIWKEEALKGTLDEITRCNEYIFAHADLDRRFTVYRDELYEYRYRIRQLQFRPGYPLIKKSDLPMRPEYIRDV